MWLLNALRHPEDMIESNGKQAHILSSPLVILIHYKILASWKIILLFLSNYKWNPPITQKNQKGNIPGIKRYFISGN